MRHHPPHPRVDDQRRRPRDFRRLSPCWRESDDRYTLGDVPANAIVDRSPRPLRNLRISVTDRCNLRCRYCMPEAEYVWLPKESILTFEEITRLARLFVSLGATKLR